MLTIEDLHSLDNTHAERTIKKAVPPRTRNSLLKMYYTVNREFLFELLNFAVVEHILTIGQNTVVLFF